MRSRLPVARVDEAEVRAVADDHVVENADPEELTRLTEPPRDLDVFRARRGIAARMVVNEKKSPRGFTHGRTEHLAGVHERRGQGPLGDLHFAELLVLRIQEKDIEDLLPQIAEATAEVLED